MKNRLTQLKPNQAYANKQTNAKQVKNQSPCQQSHFDGTSNQRLNSILFFEKISVIGQGQAAKVFLARHKASKQLYAIKQVKKSFIFQGTNKEKINILTQKNINQTADHPFIVKCFGCFQDKQKVYFVMEYCVGGQLFNRLANNKDRRFEQIQCKFYAAQVLLALQYLHENNIIYRDLKLQNLVIDKRGFLKLTDFGLSKKFDSNQKLSKENASNRTSSICGTAQYLAPEIIMKKPYTRDIDWWCFGCLIHQLFTGLPPFHCEQDEQNQMFLFKRILQEEFQFMKKKNINKKIVTMNPSQEVQDLISKLLQKHPEDRLGHKNGASQIKQHPWFSDVNFADLIYIKQGKKFQEPKVINTPKKPLLKSNSTMMKNTGLETRVTSFSQMLRSPPFVPKLKSEVDTSLFDKQFTSLKINSAQNILMSMSKREDQKDHINEEVQYADYVKLKHNRQFPMIEGLDFEISQLSDKQNKN